MRKCTYSYNGLNQLTKAETATEESVYEYDQRGNQVSEASTDETSTESTFAVTGEMLSMTQTDDSGNTSTQQNVYNYAGTRVSKTEGGVTRNYFYDNGLVAFTTDGNTLSSANLFDDSGDVIGSYRGDTYHVYLEDAQGSTYSIVKQDGSLSAAYSYSDFGETEEITGGIFDNEICYTGAVYDDETGLYYLNARYYNPETGRFVSQDSYRGSVDNPGQWHLYAYCANNPINYIDPSGHDFIYLTSTNGACGAGHAAILIKYGGTWRYYSWEGKGYKSSHAKLMKITDGVKGKKVYEKINDDLAVNRPDHKPYDKYFYISAGSKSSYTYAREIMEGKHYRSYDLGTYNCAWVAIDILKHGSIGKGKKKSLEGVLYKNVKRNGKTYKIIRTLIPNTVDDKIAKIFGMTVKNVI